MSTRGECLQFCPTHDLTRPNYTTPVFSVRTEIKGGVCADMEDILTQVDRTDYMCWTARHQNAHQCGCNGGVAWYLGADTKRKHAVLTWVPRVSGFLSLLGSGFILYDIIRNHKQSITTYHWLVMGMSFFDLFSSMAWVVASLAVPEEDYTGETGTCTYTTEPFGAPTSFCLFVKFIHLLYYINHCCRCRRRE